MENKVTQVGQGKVDIIFIGTGKGKGGGLTYGDTNAIVQKLDIQNQKMNRILIDFGTTNANSFPINAGGLNINASEIDAILLTSLEPDHIGGLVSFTLKNATPANKIKILVPSQDFFDAFAAIALLEIVSYNPAATVADYFTPEIISAANSSYGGIKFEYFSQANNHGLIIDDRIYYSGDTTDINNLKTEGAKATIKYIFQKCDFSEFNKTEYDLLKDDTQLTQTIRNKMYLMHYNAGAVVMGVDFGGLVNPKQVFTVQ